jgi:sphingomyelin phosphodiesterase
MSISFWLFDSDTFQYVLCTPMLTHSDCVSRPDPNGILAFLIQCLQAAEDALQRVWIIGHMPPGSSDALRDQVGFFVPHSRSWTYSILASPTITIKLYSGTRTPLLHSFSGTAIMWDLNPSISVVLTYWQQDEFEIAYSDYAHQTSVTATNVAFIAPALTTRSNLI